MNSGECFTWFYVSSETRRMKIKTCASCKWANWSNSCLTPTGRFKKDCCGRCDYPVPPIPKLPWATAEIIKRQTASGNPFTQKYGIQPDSGEGCDVYEEAEVYPGKK